MLALSDGRLDEAEALAEEARVIGERVQADMATPVYLMHRYTLCDLRGRLEAIAPAIAELAAEPPVAARVPLRARAPACAARAVRVRHGVARGTGRDASALPFDQEWLFGMSFLAEAAGLLATPAAGAALLERLAPWAALNVVDQCEGMRGSAARYVGILAADRRAPGRGRARTSRPRSR